MVASDLISHLSGLEVVITDLDSDRLDQARAALGEDVPHIRCIPWVELDAWPAGTFDLAGCDRCSQRDRGHARRPQPFRCACFGRRLRLWRVNPHPAFFGTLFAASGPRGGQGRPIPISPSAPYLPVANGLMNWKAPASEPSVCKPVLGEENIGVIIRGASGPSIATSELPSSQQGFSCQGDDTPNSRALQAALHSGAGASRSWPPYVRSAASNRYRLDDRFAYNRARPSIISRRSPCAPRRLLPAAGYRASAVVGCCGFWRRPWRRRSPRTPSMVRDHRRDARCTERIFRPRHPLRRPRRQRLHRRPSNGPLKKSCLRPMNGRSISRAGSASFSELNAALHSLFRRLHGAREAALRLAPRGGSSRGSLAWTSDTRSAPGPGDVEIEVAATGLNFRDVMWNLGLLPEEALEDGYAGPALGMECAGTISAVRSGRRRDHSRRSRRRLRLRRLRQPCDRTGLCGKPLAAAAHI